MTKVIRINKQIRLGDGRRLEIMWEPPTEIVGSGQLGLDPFAKPTMELHFIDSDKEYPSARRVRLDLKQAKRVRDAMIETIKAMEEMEKTK